MNPKDKIKTKRELGKITLQLKKRGKKIVTTNGTFDLIHLAHLNFLEKAKSLGDILVVLINSDASVRKLKGKNRPIIPQNERALHLAHLSSVDYVSIFSESTPLKFLKTLKPDIHTKGGTFLPERIAEEKSFVESWGGKFIIFGEEKGYSSTKIIEKILQRYFPTK